ncbi:hypothetical protein COV18_00200 [Candidatus Woesearchaeota archaeon CG10_big_fil_rev_8_21_14_0_10_37_12]|nr:MAG: hypothetical protein COV18_00200 [Candidatus Woesearchaeota archaeon CG10_big_fil_rev_8_21_14_0_10_37_12]
MLQYILWGVSFITLWLVIIWLNFLYSSDHQKKQKRLPKITLTVPVFNEEKTILKTLISLVDADYPKQLTEILVVNDGSTDNTASIVKKFQKNHSQVILINQKNAGKAAAMNAALDVAKGELFAVIDADSRIEPDALQKMILRFSNKQVGAVISRIKVEQPKNLLERMQRFEYIMSTMTRFIMKNFGTLAITHGALSLFKTSVVKKLGGFARDKNNLTEDFEIALRLRYNGYLVEMEPTAISHTCVPPDLHMFWRQRMRWSRGYIYNMWNYRKMIFSKKHGVFGTFQLPVNVAAIVILVANVGIILYDFTTRFFDFFVRSLTLDDYFLNTLLDLPTVKEFVLARNIQVTIPILLSLALGIYLIIFAHRVYDEKLKSHLVPLLAYTFFIPYFSTANWLCSIVQEVRKAKRRW